MKKSNDLKQNNFFKKLTAIICVAGCAASAVLWQIFSEGRSYYLICTVIIILSMLPFFADFERRGGHARETALIAALTAIAVVSRALFYLIPQVKPIGAVVIICGVCLGAKRGYLIGALSAFISNFIFGQGIWTPFQMAALGTVGFLAGLIFSRAAAKRVPLAIAGFVLIFVVYGLIVDLSTVLVMTTDYSFASVFAIYASGAVFNLVFAAVTAICLFAFGESFVKKINRITLKYGILKN